MLQTMSTIPLFASRPFLAAFVLGMLARYGGLLPFVEDSSGLAGLASAPEWFIHPYTLLVLGMLALLEIIATKNNEVRQLMRSVDSTFKAVVAFLITFSLVNGESIGILEGFATAAPGIPLAAAFVDFEAVLAWIVPFIMAAGVWFVAHIRGEILGLLMDSDQEDHLGLQNILSWAEDFTVVWGTFVVVLFPVLALIIAALTIGGLFATQKYLEHLDEQSKVACPTCGTLMYPTATRCHTCHTDNPNVMQPGWFGEVTTTPARNLSKQPIYLISHHRCPSCAVRLPKNTIQQSCPTCDTITFSNAADVNRYIRMMQKRLPFVLIVSVLLSAIPLVGLVPGIIFYRVALISSLQQYLPRTVGCLTNWPVRLLNIGLIALQPVPGLGVFALPLMVVSNFAIYQQMLVRSRDNLFRRDTPKGAGNAPINP